VTDRPDRQKTHRAAHALRALARGLKPEGDVSLSDVLAWRDEGRAGIALVRAASAVGVQTLGGELAPPKA
jgi:hypothetical protein